MSYTAAKPKEPVLSEGPDKYARLRGENERARLHYQREANRELQAVVEKERRHLQAQVDATVLEAKAAIEKAIAERDHWMDQCEEVYQLLEDTTAKAEEEIARLRAEIDRLKKAQPKVKRKKRQRWEDEEGP